MEEKQYKAPVVEELEIFFEGFLCGSNEDIDENEGIW